MDRKVSPDQNLTAVVWTDAGLVYVLVSSLDAEQAVNIALAIAPST